MKRTIFCFLVLVFLVSTQDAQNPGGNGFGEVRGRVVDGTATPIEGAIVSSETTEEDGGNGEAGILQTATTNKHGEFVLARVPEGVNLILASKAGDYYPDVRFAFFATDASAFPRVRVAPGAVVDNVVVRLTQKGGRIVGRIVDSRTGEPVIACRIHLRRQDDPGLTLSIGPDMQGRFDLVVPARPFFMEVSAPGYRTWSLPKEKGAVSVAPESVTEQPVLLEREPDANPRGN